MCRGLRKQIVQYLLTRLGPRLDHDVHEEPEGEPASYPIARLASGNAACALK